MIKDLPSESLRHRLCTPLNAIIGFTGTLLMKLPGPLNTDQERQLQIIQDSARQLLALIDSSDEKAIAHIQSSGASEAGEISENPTKRSRAKKIGKPRILFIDDDPMSRKLMSYLLDVFGYEALMAEDGEQGLAIARREIPDLILSDVHMPKFDGFELARKLKADPVLRNIPLVAVSALASPEHRDDPDHEMFDYFLTKPIRPEVLKAKLSHFLAGGVNFTR